MIGRRFSLCSLSVGLLGAHGAESFHLYSKSKRAGRDMISNRTLNTSISDRSILAAASILDRCSDGLRLLFGRRATAHPLYEIRKTGVSVFRTRSHSSLSRIQVHSRPFSGRFKIIVTQTPLQMQICAQNAYKGFFVLGGGYVLRLRSSCAAWYAERRSLLMCELCTEFLSGCSGKTRAYSCQEKAAPLWRGDGRVCVIFLSGL